MFYLLSLWRRLLTLVYNKDEIRRSPFRAWMFLNQTESFARENGWNARYSVRRTAWGNVFWHFLSEQNRKSIFVEFFLPLTQRNMYVFKVIMFLLLRGAYTLTTLVMSKNGKLSLGKICRVTGSFSSLTFICVNCIWPRYQETNGYYVHDEARDHALVCWNHRFHCVFNRMLQYDWSLSVFICSLIGCSVFKLSDLDRLISNTCSRTDQAGKVGSQSKLSLLAIS